MTTSKAKELTLMHAAIYPQSTVLSHDQLLLVVSRLCSYDSVAVANIEGRQRIGYNSFITSNILHTEVIYRFNNINEVFLIKYFNYPPNKTYYHLPMFKCSSWNHND
jgi:hypothetical protein